MTRHKAAGQTLVAGELREALRELPYMTPVEVGGEPVHLVEVGETVALDCPRADDLEALEAMLGEIADGTLKGKALTDCANELVSRFSRERADVS